MQPSETVDRLRRHAAEIVALTLMCLLLGLMGVFPATLPLWFVPSVTIVGALLVTLAYSRWTGEVGSRAVTTRIVVQGGILTAMTYATGWGFALPLVHLFAVADNVKHNGSRAVTPVTISAAGWTAVAQVLLTLGLTPNIHEPVSDTWAIALFMVLTVTGVGARVRHMAREREAVDLDRRESAARFQHLVEDASDVVLLIRDGVIRYASPSLAHVLGHVLSEDDELAYLDFVHPEDIALVIEQVRMLQEDPTATGAIECRLRHADGRWVHVETRVRNLADVGAVAGFVVNLRDVSERHRLLAELEHQALHDELTGLPNRSLFRDRVAHAVARSRRSELGTAVLSIDLDGFKAVNDTRGHLAGDAVLREVGRRIARCTRESDTSARIGADEFAVLLEGLDAESEAAHVAERVITAVAEPMNVEGTTVEIDASVGIAVWERGWTAEELTRNADVAMYASKSGGPGAFEVFVPAMHERVVQRLTMERELDRAIREDRLTLHYQPIVELDDDRVVGVEALARWIDPDRGAVSPGVFIPLAEETGMIVELGRWALRTALQQAATWQTAFGGGRVGMSVNVSSRQLLTTGFAGDVARIITDTGVDPASVTLELTESAIVQDAEHAIRVMRELKDLGVRLAIDDFGTGYSSLSYLQRFPLDELKIDRTFIEGMVVGTQSPALVRAIVEMSRSLDLKTVAEGIENDEELRRVRTMACQLGQGYHFGRPAPADELTASLASTVMRTVVGEG